MMSKDKKREREGTMRTVGYFYIQKDAKVWMNF